MRNREQIFGAVGGVIGIAPGLYGTYCLMLALDQATPEMTTFIDSHIPSEPWHAMASIAGMVLPVVVGLASLVVGPAVGIGVGTCVGRITDRFFPAQENPLEIALEGAVEEIQNPAP